MVRVRCPRCQTVMAVTGPNPVCSTCGFAGTAATAAAPEGSMEWQTIDQGAMPAPMEPKRGKAGLVVGILLAILLLLGAGVLAYYYYGPDLLNP